VPGRPRDGEAGGENAVPKKTILLKTLPVGTMSARVLDLVARADSRRRKTWQS
jgi:hypothetical protein